VAITPLIPEIKALLPTSKLEAQLHRPPFALTAGQIVQATVSSEEAPNLFTLQIGGQKIPIETSVNLSTGQNLSLEVTALSPQLQLKVVDQSHINGLDQRIGASLQTILHQGESFSELASLTQAPALSVQLSPNSQHVLQQMQTQLLGNVSESSSLAAIITQLASVLSATEGSTTTAGQKEAMSALLQQINALPAAPTAIRQEAANLAKIFSPPETNGQLLQQQGKNFSNGSSVDLLGNIGITKDEAIQQLQKLPGTLQTALQPLIEQQLTSSNPSQPLTQVLKFILQAAQESKTAPPPSDGVQFKQSLAQLGTQMERLLSQGKSQEAANLAKIFFLSETNRQLPQQGKTVSNGSSVDLLGNIGITKDEAILQLQKLPGVLQTALQPLIGQQLTWSNPSQPLTQILKFILQAAQESKTAPPPPDGVQLKQSLEQLGTQMERLLFQGKSQEAANTLKFALLEITSLGPGPTLQKAADDVLSTIQFSQLVQMRLGAESIFFMPLPFPFLQSGFLLIDHEHQKSTQDNQQKKRQPTDLSLYLQLEGLGNLNITVHQEGNNIALTFYSQDSSRARFISQHKDELKDMLTTGTLYTAQFLVGAKEPVKILIEKMLHAPTGMVNISA